MTGLPDLFATVSLVGLILGACLLAYVFWPRVARDFRRDRARERAEETSDGFDTQGRAVSKLTMGKNSITFGEPLHLTGDRDG